MLNTLLIIGGVVAGVEWFVIETLKARGWDFVAVARNDVRFPSVCPACLGSTQPAAPVEEKSSMQYAAWRVFYTTYKYVTLEIPYCERCAKLVSDRNGLAVLLTVPVATAGGIAAVMLAGGFGVGAFIIGAVVPGYPLYSLINHSKRAVVLRRFNDHVVELQCRHQTYATTLRMTNSAPTIR